MKTKLEVGMSYEEKHKWLEENLENGMYVRTDNGIDRFQFKYKEDNKTFYWYYFENSKLTNPESYIIGEPSFNILDVIKPGDYVNGDKVSFIAFCSIYWNTGNAIHKKYIETVVTKEQFEACKYEVNHEKINK